MTIFTIQGRLLYCHSPPGYDACEFQLLGRNQADSFLPVGLGRVNESKVKNIVKRSKEKSNKFVDCDQDLFIKSFDQMAFSQVFLLFIF